MFLGLRTAIYHVADLARAKAWYSDVLGAAPYFDQPFYVGFNVGGFELGLQPDPTNTRPKGESVAVYWGVPKAREAFERLVKLGALPFEEPQDVGGDIVVATVRDPFGNLLGVIENPGFK